MFNVLIVEDEPNNLESIRRALIDFGKFNNGEIFPGILEQQEYVNTIIGYAEKNLVSELREYIGEKIDSFNIDVLVVDLRLSAEGNDNINESEGMKLIEALRKDTQTKNVPIVIFSALGSLNNITINTTYSHIYVLGKPAMVTTNNVSNVLNEVMEKVIQPIIEA